VKFVLVLANGGVVNCLYKEDQPLETLGTNNMMQLKIGKNKKIDFEIDGIENGKEEKELLEDELYQL